MADLDADGTAETISAFFSQRGSFGFLTIESTEGVHTSPILPIWSLSSGDLDGNGTAELIVGAISGRPRSTEPDADRTVWVYGWRQGALAPLYLASALSRPMVDFRVRDVDGDNRDELVALESSNGVCFLTTYQWTGFGFSGRDRQTINCDSMRFCDESSDNDAHCVSLF